MSGRHEGAFGDWTHLVILECRIDGTGRAQLAVAATSKATLRAGLSPTDARVDPNGNIVVVGSGLPFNRQLTDSAESELLPFVVSSQARDPNAADPMARLGLLEFLDMPGAHDRCLRIAGFDTNCSPVVLLGTMREHEQSLRGLTLPSDGEPQTIVELPSPFEPDATRPLPTALVGQDLVAAAGHELALRSTRGTPRRLTTIRIARVSPGSDTARSLDVPTSTFTEVQERPVVHDLMVFTTGDQAPWALLAVSVGQQAYLVSFELPL